MPNNDGTLSDAEVFGAMPQHELTDAQVFGMPESPQSSILDKVNHYSGLAAGTFVRGLGYMGDIGPGIVNAAHSIYTNSPEQYMPMPFSELANKYAAGTDPWSGISRQPQNEIEQKAQDIGAGVMSGAMGGPTAMIGGGAATVGQQMAQQAGATPREQMLVAALAGTGATAATGAARMAIGPLTGTGKNTLMSKYLLKNTQNPETAVSNLGNIPEYVPNSPATAGPASKDYGLMGLERGVKNVQGSNFGEIGEMQNAARNNYLQGVAGTPQDLSGEIQNRDMTAGAMRDAAFANKTNVLPTEPLDTIDGILSSPVGKRDAVAASMGWVRDKLLGVKDPEELYAVRQDINDAMQGKFNQDKPALALAKSQLKDVKTALDSTIERGAPGFKDYVSKYADMSKPINQMETLQDLQKNIGNTSKDPISGLRQLSQAKLDKNMTMNEDLANLTPEQHGVLANIEKDLNRSNSINSPLVRPAGSDTTANNMMVAALKRVPGLHGVYGDTSVLPGKVAEILQDPAKTRAMLLKGMAEPSMLTRIGRNYAAMLLAQQGAQNQGSR